MTTEFKHPKALTREDLDNVLNVLKTAKRDDQTDVFVRNCEKVFKIEKRIKVCEDSDTIKEYTFVVKNKMGLL